MFSRIKNMELALTVSPDDKILGGTSDGQNIYFIPRRCGRQRFSLAEHGGTPTVKIVDCVDELEMWVKISGKTNNFEGLFSHNLAQRALYERANILISEGWEGLASRVKSTQQLIGNILTETLNYLEFKEKSRKRIFRGFLQDVKQGRKASTGTFEVETILNLFSSEKRKVLMGFSPRLFEERVWDCKLQFYSSQQVEYLYLMEKGPSIIKEAFESHGLNLGTFNLDYLGSHLLKPQ